MDKVFQIVIIFLLLFLVIRISVNAGIKYKDFYLIRQLQLPAGVLIETSIIYDRMLALKTNRGIYSVDLDNEDAQIVYSGSTEGDLFCFGNVYGKACSYDRKKKSITLLDFEVNKPLISVGFNWNEPCLLYMSDRFVFCFLDNRAVVLNSANLLVAQSVLLPGCASKLVEAEKDRLLISFEGSPVIILLDLQRLKIIRQWNIEGNKQIKQIAVDPVRNLVFATNSDLSIAVLDYSSGKKLQSIVTDFPIRSMSFNSKKQLLLFAGENSNIGIYKQLRKSVYQFVQSIDGTGGIYFIKTDNNTGKIIVGNSIQQITDTNESVQVARLFFYSDG